VAASLKPLLEEISRNSAVILRMRIAVHTPMVAMMAQKMAANGQNAAAIDPDAPLIEVSQEVSELSGAPVDAALFEVPKDFTSVAPAVLLGGMMHAPQAGAP